MKCSFGTELNIHFKHKQNMLLGHKHCAVLSSKSFSLSQSNIYSAISKSMGKGYVAGFYLNGNTSSLSSNEIMLHMGQYVFIPLGIHARGV